MTVSEKEGEETDLVRRLARRLEQLLSDPNATSLQVVDRLFEGEPLGLQWPATSLHLTLVHALAEAVESDGRDWLVVAIERFLDRLGEVPNCAAQALPHAAPRFL